MMDNAIYCWRVQNDSAVAISSIYRHPLENCWWTPTSSSTWTALWGSLPMVLICWPSWQTTQTTIMLDLSKCTRAAQINGGKWGNMSIIRETPAGKASGIPYYSAANWESTLGDENANNESHVWRHQKHQELLLAFNILIFSLWGLSPAALDTAGWLDRVVLTTASLKFSDNKRHKHCIHFTYLNPVVWTFWQSVVAMNTF